MIRRRYMFVCLSCNSSMLYNCCLLFIKYVLGCPKSTPVVNSKTQIKWSRSGLRELCKSDMFVNNHCEIFNNAIKKYKEMGIVTMFKGIHTSCMQKIQRRKSKWKGQIQLTAQDHWKHLISIYSSLSTHFISLVFAFFYSFLTCKISNANGFQGLASVEWW